MYAQYFLIRSVKVPGHTVCDQLPGKSTYNVFHSGCLPPCTNRPRINPQHTFLLWFIFSLHVTNMYLFIYDRDKYIADFNCVN